MKIPPFLLLWLLVATLTLPTVLAEGDGRVTLVNDNTLFMDYDQEIRHINNSPMAWADDTPIQFFETDRDVEVEYSVLNRNFFTLKVINSPYGTEREYSFIYCTINEIPDYDRYSYHQDNRCPYWYYAYKLRDIREGQLLTVKIPPLIDGTNAFMWYVGNGAGGGGGLPVCEGLATTMYINQTLTNYNESFEMYGRALYEGSSTAGCTANLLVWQMQNTTSYEQIPTSGLWKALSGRGTVMSQNSPVWEQWYTRKPYCEIGDRTINLRMKFDGVYNLRATTVYSPVYTVTCNSSYNTFLWKNPTPENNSVIDADTITLNSSLQYYTGNTTIFYDFNDSAYLYVPMDSYNTTAVEDVINNYGLIFKDGMSINSVVNSSLFGKALNFSADETDFTIVNESNLLDIGTGDFTFVAWLKPRGMSPTITSDETLFAKYLNSNYRYYFRFRQADYFQFYAVINGIAHNYQVSTLSPYLINNEWNLLVVGFNRTTDRFYLTINGAYAGATNTATGTGVDYTINKELLIGGFSYDYTTGQAGFNGTMDEVSFHNRLLSLEEIQMIYLGGSANLNITYNNLPYGTYNFTAWHNNVFGAYNSSKRTVTLAESEDDGVVWFMFAGFLLFNIGVYGYVRRRKRN